MSYDQNNPFARILRGELPCVKVYEDAHTLAMMDIMPQAEGHVLVLPKQAAAELLALSEESAAACMRTVKLVAQAVKTALEPPGIMIAQFNGPAAGQTVPHVHFHIVPRQEAAPLRPHAAVPADTEHLKALAGRIIAALPSAG
ncbi:HIT family protein [Massilia sp. KIM]|uniref:HIT family protein n=1 Tax=Massilia sp. KIM TaxID=1955422 RepID=UPI00098FAEF9|nr:HIT family protein [Massilia sp. KIM]OON64201.1 HIT family protein [Massilia sp. KIM]